MSFPSPRSIGRAQSTLPCAPKLEISYRNPALLKPRLSNPRTHSKKQINQIAKSIEEFGFLAPVLVDSQGGIVAGHGRAEVSKLLGMQTIPTLLVDHLSPDQIRAYIIADNKIAENAGWDPTLLAIELKALSVNLDFDVTLRQERLADRALESTNWFDSCAGMARRRASSPGTRPGL